MLFTCINPNGDSTRFIHYGNKVALTGIPNFQILPNKIKASTPYDFAGLNLTAYGGLLPVATMLEKLGFLDLITEALTIPKFILAMVLASMGFSAIARSAACRDAWNSLR